MQLMIILSLCTALAYSATGAWLNEDFKWGDFRFECQSDQGISWMSSEHDNEMEDRKYQFACSRMPQRQTLNSCEWSDFTYSRQGAMHYQCPHAGVVAGVFSKYDKKFEDRRFSLQCCNPSGKVLHSCETSQWLGNGWDRPFEFRVPSGYVMHGWTSVYSTTHSDRIYAIQYCKMGETVDIKDQ